MVQVIVLPPVLCKCGCGRPAGRYFHKGRFKNYLSYALDCPTRAGKGPWYRGSPGEANPHYQPIGSTAVVRRSGKQYRKVKVADPSVWQYEHRVVAERTLGRALLPTEHVHHIDGDGLNNRADNLVALSRAEHKRLEATLSTEQWAVHYAACVLCGETTSAHVSKGRCSRCYQRLWRQTH